jgi:hypothetical protein
VFSSLPLVKEIGVVHIQAKTFSSLLLFKRFGCAFKQNLSLPLFKIFWLWIQAKPFPSFVQDILAMDSSKPFPPSKPSCKNTEGLVE